MKPYRFIVIHIDMVLSILNISPHGFGFGFFPQNVLYKLDIIQSYILISFFHS